MNLPPADLQRLLAEEPFVRALAQSLVAGDADDVVQQAYLRAMERRPASVREPRSWLARIVRNLVADDRRRRRRAEKLEAAAVAVAIARVPSSAELAESEELRRRLVAAVDGLPEQLRSVVLLRYFEGLPPRGIAKALGVPAHVVWNRLHAALVMLRTRLDAEHGGERRAWLLPLVPFATSPRALPWTEMAGALPAAPLVGVIAMTTKTKLAALGAVLLAAVLLWIAVPDAAPPRVDANPAARVEPAVATMTVPATKDEPAPGPQRERVSTAEVATTGDLVVTVRYVSEPTIAAGRTVNVRRRGGDLRVGVLRAVADADGTARFAGLAPGELRVSVAGSSTVVGASVEAGRVIACALTLRGGMTLTGIVVDATGAPIAGALVETMYGGGDGDAATVTATGSDGMFTVRESHAICLVGARAAGFAASQLQFRMNGKSGTENVRIELLAAGGAVEGIVVDAKGAVLAGAVVWVGEGQTEGIHSTSQGAPPLPAQVCTDANGRFLAIGLPVGKHPLCVRAAGCAPWIGSCEVAANATAAVRIAMQAGVTCSGRVASGGQPVDRAKVGYEGPRDFLRIAAYTDADGTFTLPGLPSDALELVAEKDRLGRATGRVRGESGASVRCDFELSNGLVLNGRVFDATGAPVNSLDFRCRAEGAGERWSSYARSDESGRFVVTQCPPGRTLSIEATLRDHLPWQRGGIDPHAGALEIRFMKDEAPRARITGRLLRPDGSGATGATISGWRQNPYISVDVVVEKSDGAFALDVPAGTWSVHMRVDGHPDVRRDGIELQSGAMHDLGILQLVRGGTLVVCDDQAAKFEYAIYDPRDRFVGGIDPRLRPPRSDLLAPGEYVLFARGTDSAAQRLPFTITADRETVLTVKPIPGIRRRIEFVPPLGADVHAVSYEIRREGARVMAHYVEAAAPKDLAQDVCLVPGDYELITTLPAPAVSVRFTIAAGASDPVRVVLR